MQMCFRAFILSRLNCHFLRGCLIFITNSCISVLPTLIFIRIDHFASCASIVQSVTSLNKKSDLQSAVF